MNHKEVGTMKLEYLQYLALSEISSIVLADVSPVARKFYEAYMFGFVKSVSVGMDAAGIPAVIEIDAEEIDAEEIDQFLNTLVTSMRASAANAANNRSALTALQQEYMAEVVGEEAALRFATTTAKDGRTIAEAISKLSADSLKKRLFVHPHLRIAQ